MLLSNQSNWEQKYTKEELAEMGWELVDPEEQGFTFDKDKVGKLIESNFSLASLSLVDAFTRDKLVNKLTKDADILVQVCQELELEIPHDENEEKDKIKAGETLNNPTNQSLKDKLLEQLKQIPGVTVALNRPWWIYLLIALYLYLYLYLYLKRGDKNKHINNYSLDNQGKRKTTTKQPLLTNNNLLLMLGVMAVIGLGYYYQDKLFPKADNNNQATDRKKETENKKPQKVSPSKEGEINYGNIDLNLVSEEIKTQFTKTITRISKQPASKKNFRKITVDEIDNLTIKELFPKAYKVSGNYYLRLINSHQTIELTKEYISIYKAKLKAEFKNN